LRNAICAQTGKSDDQYGWRWQAATDGRSDSRDGQRRTFKSAITFNTNASYGVRSLLKMAGQFQSHLRSMAISGTVLAPTANTLTFIKLSVSRPR